MREASHPILRTLLLSMAIAAAATVLWAVVPAETQHVRAALILATLSGVLFVAIGRAMGLGTAWLVLGAIATPALVLVPIYRPPGWLFPLCALILAGFYSNGVRERVPLFLSNAKTRAAIADLIAADAPKQVIDLGCGLGGVVVSVAKACPSARVIGVETAPLTFLLAWLRVTLLGPRNAEIRFRSIWQTDVSNADAVYAFLSPAPMTRLNDKLRAEMKPGALFISNSFAVPGIEPQRTVAVDDRRQTQLLLWRMG